jgi:Tol biopolymer transport system component
MIRRVQTLRIAALVVVVLACASCSSAHRSTPQPRHVSRIAFEQDERIWIADRDGRNRRFLIHGESPEISPDGHWVAFYPCNACALEVIDSDGGRARLLAKNVNPPVWSPDSRHVATVGLTSGPNFAERLSTVDRVTGRHHTIATAPNILGLDFSRDGKRLAFAISHTPDDLHSDVYVSAAEGGAVRRVTWDDRSSWPVWAPGRSRSRIGKGRLARSGCTRSGASTGSGGSFRTERVEGP